MKAAGRARRALVAVLLTCATAVPASGLASAQGAIVPMTWEQVEKKALALLTDEERKRGILYVDEQELPAGSTLTIDGREIPVRRRSAAAFVDRVPQANWGHPSRYLLIDLESGEAQSIESQFPPFLRATPPTLKVVHKGEAVPDWTVARP
jgi:hypothetical protein